MRPYLAIIKDSFRAALASRVLYVLLAIITLLLAAIAPFHVREIMDWEIGFRDNVTRPHDMVERIIERKDDRSYPEMARIWGMLSEEMKIKLQDVYDRGDNPAVETESDPRREFNEGPPRPHHPGLRPSQYQDEDTYRAFVDELNVIVQNREFYREADWNSRTLDAEADDLAKTGTLSEERSRRLNRLLLADAFGSTLQSGVATSLNFYYGLWKIDMFTTNTTHQQFASIFSSTIPFIFDKFIMSVGLAIAILVTANIIPETFDEGSLNLLLSKPISRSGLLIAKFIGGCAFVALCAADLFVGVWIWMGLAMKYWDPGVLLSIPIYILAFAIYYSVSTLVGLMFRSAILSVILTVIFWGACFGIGSIHGFFDTRMENTDITRLVPLNNDRVLQVDPLQRVLGWNAAKGEWENKLKSEMLAEQEVAIGMVLFFDSGLDGMPDQLGPIHDSETDLLFASTVNFGDPASMMGAKDCFVSNFDVIAFERRGNFPQDTLEVFDTALGLLCVTSSGDFYRLDKSALDEATKTADLNKILEAEEGEAEEGEAEEGETDEGDESAATEKATAGDDSVSPEKSATESETEPDTKTDETETPADETDAAATPAATVAATPTKSKPLFRQIDVADPVTIRNASHVAFNRSNQEIVIYRRGTITKFAPDGEGYRRISSLEIDTGIQSQTMSCKIEYQGNTILIALGNGQIITVDSNEMKEKNGYLPESRAGLDQITATSDGRWFALIYTNENLWMLDTQDDAELAIAPFSGQGKISAVAFDGNDRVWIADREDRATLYDLTTMKQVEQFTPVAAWFASAHRLVIDPLYRIFPKPSELYKVVAYLSSTSDTKYNREVDLAGIKPEPDPWSPVYSGLGFMAVTLLIGCVYFHFKDF